MFNSTGFSCRGTPKFADLLQDTPRCCAHTLKNIRGSPLNLISQVRQTPSEAQIQNAWANWREREGWGGEIDLVAAGSVDRLGRSLQDLCGILGKAHAKGCELCLHQQAIETRTPAGKALFG